MGKVLQFPKKPRVRQVVNQFLPRNLRVSVTYNGKTLAVDLMNEKELEEIIDQVFPQPK
jgi:hypothetical protein